ncbi:MAG: DUF2304 domain-containing protein [Bacilli bacterium]
MSTELRVWMCLVSLLFAVIITIILKKGRMPIKYALVWYCADTVVLLTSLFPFLINHISKFFGFETISNFIICLIIVILIFITIVLTIIISGQNVKIKLLIQEVSLLKAKVKNGEKK